MAEAAPTDHPEALNARLDLAAALAAQGRHESANKIYREILALSGERGSSSPTDSVGALGAEPPAARALRALGEPAKALEVYRSHLEAETRELGRGHPYTQQTLHNLAETCAEAGRLDEAYQLWSELLPLQAHSWGPTSVQAVGTIGRLVLLSSAMGRWSEAVQHCEAYLAVDADNLGPAHHCATLARLSGQDQICREQCELLISHAVAETNDLNAAKLAARTCLVVGESATDLPLVFHLADKGVRSRSASAASPLADPNLQLLQGLTEYRTDRPEQAVTAIRPLATVADARGLLALYVMALAHQQLNQPQEAEAFFTSAERRLNDQLHTGTLTDSADFGLDNVEMCEALVIRAEAELALFGRQSAPDLDAGRLAVARKSWLPVKRWLHRVRRCCLERRWRDAVEAWHSASQEPSFKWSTARLELPEVELMIGTALVRLGELQRHEQLCRMLADKLGECSSPRAAAETAAQVCLLPTSPTPELLSLASNSVMRAQAETPGYGQREEAQLIQGWLAYRSARHSDVVSALRQVSNSHLPERRALALLLQSLAAARLGQTVQGEELLHRARSLVFELTELGAAPERFPSVQIVLLLLEEADEAAARSE
jgi:tetratricopeptide (TPR) repeat protein